MNKTTSLLALGMVGALAMPACDLDVPDLNNPGLNELEAHPTRVGVNTAATGLLIANRIGKSTTAGYVNQLGIVGREAYDFDPSESRFVSELIQGPLIKNSPFGGVFWANNYASILLANIALHSVPNVPDFSDAERERAVAGIQGFAHTIQAMELLVVIVTHDSTGAVIDVDHPLGEPLGPFVPRDEVYVEIARLLDQAKGELEAATKARGVEKLDDEPVFTFTLSPGFTGFTKPHTFLQFNRALQARVAAYRASLKNRDSALYQQALDALAESFIVDTGTPNFNLGAFYTFTLGAGDATNGLINKNIYAHPSFKTEAQMQMVMSSLPDARYLAKINDRIGPDNTEMSVSASTDTSMTTTLKFKIYPTSSTSIAIIRNEELILLKAEALWFTGKHTEALAELNVVRTLSGKLAPLTAVDVPDDAMFLQKLLYERKYSLMYEGGHRWIDLRRFGIELPLDAPAHVRNNRYPVPQAECDARGTEAACNVKSTDPI